MTTLRLSILFGLIFLVSCRGSATIAELEQRNELATSSTGGKAFEIEAVRAFWGDASFMRECAPPEAPTAESLTIYFEVRTDGSLGNLVVTPDTPVGRCIVAAVQDRRFPQPDEDFVAKIDLSFTH